DFNSIISAIPRTWKRKLNQFNADNNNNEIINKAKRSINLNSKEANKILNKREFEKNAGITKLEETFNEEQIKDIFLLPRKVVDETRLWIFQYKVLHNILICNEKLQKMNIKESNKCPNCNMRHTIKHMLWECEKNNEIWTRFSTYMEKAGYKIKITENDILYGHKPKDDGYIIFNAAILIMKHALYTSFLENLEPSYYQFIEHFKLYVETKNVNKNEVWSNFYNKMF
ncbi:unnamed protein product, partial [Owenia fusiformis]